MAETPHGSAGRVPGGASQQGRVWYPLHRCPECGAYTRIIRRPITAFGGTPPTAAAGEVYLACQDRIDPSTRPSALLRIVVSEQSESNHECGYQETLE